MKRAIKFVCRNVCMAMVTLSVLGIIVNREINAIYIVTITLNILAYRLFMENKRNGMERNCGNCKCWQDKVCCNADSDEVADFTDRGFYCKAWCGGGVENEKELFHKPV